jgi:hypothetical protein
LGYEASYKTVENSLHEEIETNRIYLGLFF